MIHDMGFLHSHAIGPILPHAVCPIKQQHISHAATDTNTRQSYIRFIPICATASKRILIVALFETSAYYLCFKKRSIMKILHLSDTHGCHHRMADLPEADVVIHSGDFTMNGSEQEAVDFLNWFCDLDYRHKIFICGNHDESLYGAGIDGLDVNTHYLCNSGIELFGLKFYGVPMFMRDCVTGRQDVNYAKIPVDTNILITHAPPYGIMDSDDNVNYGSRELLLRLGTVKPRLHLFGHIHAAHGTELHDGIIFSNGAVMNADYSDFASPNLIEIPPMYDNTIR